MSDNIRIQDDLYLYVNKEQLDKLVIPNDKPCIGGFMSLADEVEKTLMKEFRDLSKSKEYPNENIKKAVTLYNLAKDVKRRNKDGIKPIQKHLDFIKGTTDFASFNKRSKAFILNGYPLPFNMDVEVDFRDSNKHGLFMMGPQTILPDSTMYAPTNPQKDMILGLWKTMVTQVLSFTDLSEEERTLYINDTLEFDAILATLVKSAEEKSDYVNLFNLYDVKKVHSLVKPINFKGMLKKIFGFVPENMAIGEPKFIEGFKTLMNEENFPKYIHWAYINYLVDKATYLSEDLRITSGMYSRALTGVSEPASAQKFAYDLASSVISEPVGVYYGEKYFGEEAKKDITEMVYEIINAYKERIASNDVLTKETKEKAIRKLSVMKVKMAYPDSVRPIFDKITVNPRSSLFKNMLEIKKVKMAEAFSKLKENVDKNTWLMPGHMVNACYDPQRNDITFPAAILQAPFYSIKQSRSENLGGIGAVIGHEISHAFDNNGAKFDENGIIKNWWTEEDFKNFEKKTEQMVEQFEGITLPYGQVNSRLIVSENIADNGGVAVTLHIMKHMKDADYQAYFKNWARIWCMKATDQFSALLLTMDVHGPKELRANMPPRNFSEWYETFDVTENDKMYIEPSKRLVIW